MRRIILDTNIYGRIVDERQIDIIKNRLGIEKTIVVYGFNVVRKEIRDLSGKVRLDGRSLRLMLLGLYDSIVKEHCFQVTLPIERLAEEYATVYREFGKSVNHNTLNDFLIVACATLHELDVVISDDNDTMLSDFAVKSYKIVNSLRGYRNPRFMGYQDFKRLITL